MEEIVQRMRENVRANPADFARVLGDPLEPPIHFEGRQWAVTGHGLQLRDGKYAIPKERLWENDAEHSWVLHMAEKEWVDIEDFMVALTIAREIYIALHPDNDRY